VSGTVKLGYFSPMPPAATGVADYSAALLPHLQALGEVRVNQCGDVNLYHLGNNALHGEIYQRALIEPGIVVMHDSVLQHFFLGSLHEAAYIEEFVYNYGEWSRGLAQELWKERARSGADSRYFAHPMLKRVLTASKAVIVHNPAAAAIAHEHAPEARIFEIPHLFVGSQLPGFVDTMRFRQSLGVGSRTLLIGAFGHQRETKRLHIVLVAYEQALARGADVRLLVSGEFVAETYARSIAPRLQHAKILRTPYLAEPDFLRHLAATDLCVNLRYPSAAESSGVAIRMMGLGKAVAFTRDAAISRFPEAACLRIDAGPAEQQMLADYIVWMASNRDALEAVGQHAARHIAQEHAPAKIAAAYWNVINKM
jgi:glycosyltransferase involved in cell wall biosynthesis